VQELDLSSLIQWTFQSVLLKKAGNGQIETTIVMSSVQAADIDGLLVSSITMEFGAEEVAFGVIS